MIIGYKYFGGESIKWKKEISRIVINGLNFLFKEEWVELK